MFIQSFILEQVKSLLCSLKYSDLVSLKFRMTELLHDYKKLVKPRILLSGRVLDSRPKGHGFEPHRRHCVVCLSKTHLS